MKYSRLWIVMVIAILGLMSGLVFAQEVTVQPVSGTSLPSSMDNSLVPCVDGVETPCDVIATQAEDIVGVWQQYLLDPFFNAPAGMAFIRYNLDGTFVLADTAENTAAPYENYPRGTYHFEGAQFVIDPVEGVPEPCGGASVFQLRVVKYGEQPVALRYVPINDACVSRLQDLSQALIWVAPSE